MFKRSAIKKKSDYFIKDLFDILPYPFDRRLNKKTNKHDTCSNSIDFQIQ